jgi:3-hydroxybutyryl-CoA dehydratase
MDSPTTLAPVSLTISQALIREYAELTQDFNPLHLDARFAAATPMGGIIAHGTLSMNLIWQSLAETLGERAQQATLDVKFMRPVRVGDRVTARGHADAAVPGQYIVWVENQRGEQVIAGTVVLPAC